MFTGLVEELGTVLTADSGRVRLAATDVLADAAIGDSIAVNGCCLTVIGLGPDWWEAELSAETVARTTLGSLGPGDPVNLERPVRLADRLGGHLVQGHVDGVGQVTSEAPDLAVEVPADLARYVVSKGSICVDGVSLTVASLDGSQARFAVIPHTADVTTLGRRTVGEAVNIEVDITAKYVERLLVAQTAEPQGA